MMHCFRLVWNVGDQMTMIMMTIIVIHEEMTVMIDESATMIANPIWDWQAFWQNQMFLQQ